MLTTVQPFTLRSGIAGAEEFLLATVQMEQLVHTLEEVSSLAEMAEERWSQAQDDGSQLWIASCVCVVVACVVVVAFVLSRRDCVKGSGLRILCGGEEEGGADPNRSASSSEDSTEGAFGGLSSKSERVPPLSFSEVFNLEEFMAVAYQRGVRVTKVRVRGKGKTRKMRLLSLNRHGEVMLHKIKGAKISSLPSMSLSMGSGPYWRCPLHLMGDCFDCGEGEGGEGKEEGWHTGCGFIMDFSHTGTGTRGKTLHLEVASATDRSYLVKGFRLLAQKAKADASFFARSMIVLSAPLTSQSSSSPTSPTNSTPRSTSP
jgi:hypothetical protein